jgi:amino acid adenylation domain-containing protein
MAEHSRGVLMEQDSAVQDPAAIVQLARDAGIELRVEGARLRFRAPDGALTPALREMLRSRRDALIAQLRAEAAADRKTGGIGANQRGLWFLNRLAPASAAYNVGFAARIHGPVDVQLLHEAVQVLVDRHESLRTIYPEVAGEPARVVVGYQPVDFVYRASAVASDDELREAVVAEYARPFDPATGPLFRAALFEESAQSAVILLAAHHLAVDGTSLFVLLDELFAAYAALADGQPIPLRAVETQFTDFVEWQQVAVKRDGGDAVFWKDALTPPPTPLDLFPDRPRPAVPRLNGRTLRSTLDAAISSRVARLAKEEETTEFVVLLALWFSFLHRLTSHDDVTVGTPVHGRSSVRFDRTVGDLINMVPLRMRDIGPRSLRTLLRDAHRTTMQSLSHQDFPLPWMTELTAGGRNTIATPFQSLFVLQDFSQFGDIQRLFLGDECERITLGGLTLSPFPFDQQEGQFDLSLEACRTGDTLACVWKYDTDLFDESTVRRHIDEYRTFVADALQRPDTPIAALEILPAEQRAQLDAWNETQREYPDATLPRLIEEQAARCPGAIAVSAPDGDYTYGELVFQAKRIATQLRSMGVRAGDRVAVMVPRVRAMVASLLGVLGTGATYVPVDALYPAARVSYMLEDSRSKVVIGHGAVPLEINAMTPVFDVAKVGDAAPEAAAPEPFTDVDRNATAYVIYTSGSTGKPKGVAVQHRSLVNFLTSMADRPGFGATDSLLAVTTISFDIAGLELYLPLITGGRVVIASEEDVVDGRRLAERLRDDQITVLQATPATWKLMLESGWTGQPGLRSLCGGEALSESLADELCSRTAELWNLYGPTETTVWSTTERIRPGEQILVGRPIANTTAYVLDSAGRRTPIGVPGELWIGGDGVAAGYVDRPELTAERFIDSPFREGERLYRTGDLVRFTPDGRIQHLGRLDNQVKVRGYRIELGEIEARLIAHPDVADAVVVALNDRLFAYLVARDAMPDADNLRAWAGTTLPEYMVPAAFIPMDALPLTPNGKVDRRALPEPAVAAELDRSARLMPGTPTEVDLAGIWSAILEVEDPRLEDSFFELGGHSLLAARMVAAIRDRFGVNLPVRTVFESFGLGALARRVDDELTVNMPADAGPTALETFEF